MQGPDELRLGHFFERAFEAAPVAMLVVNATGEILETNAQLEALFGYPRQELLGARVELLLDGASRATHAGLRQSFLGQPQARPMGAGRDLYGRHRDGSRVPVEIGLTPMQLGVRTVVLASIVDLTERKAAQEQLQASLAEKEFLLRELHHRTKNNLQLVASILDLAASQPGRPVAEVLAESRERIAAIALVHEQLHAHGTSGRLHLTDYLAALGQQVAQAWGHGGQVSLEVVPGEVTLPLEQAIPLGLIVNELTTNAYKHAFAGRPSGRIQVRCLGGGATGRVTLEVSDDGVGLDAVRGTGGGDHLGLELVRALTRQLRATLELGPGPGTTVRIAFEVDP